MHCCVIMLTAGIYLKFNLCILFKYFSLVLPPADLKDKTEHSDVFIKVNDVDCLIFSLYFFVSYLSTGILIGIFQAITVDVSSK